MTFVEELKPKPLWGHFDRILTIPRGSKEEEQMRQYVIGVAESKDLSFEIDDTGNMVVSKPATQGYERAPTIILQCHLDMVNEKNSDVDHDFSSDAIKPRRDGVYLTATGTTLGADNGIGVAAMLAVMEADDLVHGPLELLFTVDEETGLNGAAGLDAGMLEGRRLINLDSEVEGALCVGCAGGADSHVTLRVDSAPVPDGELALAIRLYGLKGGHSGIDIHLQRGNAIQLLARALYTASLQATYQLARLEGGNKHNAIPREAFATVTMSPDEKEPFVKAFRQEVEAIQQEYRPAEPEMKLEISAAELPAEVWDETSAKTVLGLVTSLPHGVVSMSYEIPDLVETSTNLATLSLQNGSVVMLLSSRSSVASAMAALQQRIRATSALTGAQVEEEEGYPGWKPDLESPLLGLVKVVHKRELGAEPEVEAVHAGLECALIGKVISGMDMISFGPQIEFPHSPDERVKIDSVERFYKLLRATLAELATGSS